MESNLQNRRPYMEPLEHCDRPRKRQKIESSHEHLSSVESSPVICNLEQSLTVSHEAGPTIPSLKHTGLECSKAPETSGNDPIVPFKEPQYHTACTERAQIRQCTCFGTVCISLHLCVERLC